MNPLEKILRAATALETTKPTPWGFRKLLFFYFW